MREKQPSALFCICGYSGEIRAIIWLCLCVFIWNHFDVSISSLCVCVCVCVCVSYRERAEKQRMYSVSQGLNSGTTSVLALSTSADLALRRSALCVWIWRSTSRLVLARRADSWIYQDIKHNCQSLWTLSHSHRDLVQKTE